MVHVGTHNPDRILRGVGLGQRAVAPTGHAALDARRVDATALAPTSHDLTLLVGPQGQWLRRRRRDVRAREARYLGLLRLLLCLRGGAADSRLRAGALPLAGVDSTPLPDVYDSTARVLLRVVERTRHPFPELCTPSLRGLGHDLHPAGYFHGALRQAHQNGTCPGRRVAVDVCRAPATRHRPPTLDGELEALADR